MASLEASAAHWDALAEQQDRMAAAGLVHPTPAGHRAETYRRTAEALRIEGRTGIPVCVCCHKPYGQGVRIPGVR